MFSASITMMESTWIGISCCAAHYFLVLFIVSAMKIERFGSFYNVSENKIEHYFYIFDALLSSLFSFLDFDGGKYRKLRIIIYYVVIALSTYGQSIEFQLIFYYRSLLMRI